MSFSHMILLAIIAVIVIPPDKLPEVARQVARFINDLRRTSSGLLDDLRHSVEVKNHIQPENVTEKAEPEKQQSEKVEDYNQHIQTENEQKNDSTEKKPS